MRKHNKVVNSKKRRYGNYTKKDLEDAVVTVQGGMKLHGAQDEFRVPKIYIATEISW